IFLYILKRKSYLLIEKDVLSIYYFYFFKKKKIEMKTIDEFVFYKSSRKVEIRSNNQTILIIYLKDKKKRKLLDWLVQHYPNIPCLFFSENETIGYRSSSRYYLYKTKKILSNSLPSTIHSKKEIIFTFTPDYLLELFVLCHFLTKQRHQLPANPEHLRPL